MATGTQMLDIYDALRAIDTAFQPLPADDQARILRWLVEKYRVAVTENAKFSPATLLPPSPQPAGPALGPRMDLRSFVLNKAPRNDMQFAAVVAYFHRFEAVDKKQAISPQDYIEACRLSGRKRPKSPGNTLWNAVNAGVLDKAGRGEFSINHIGENLVAMVLPSEVNGRAPGADTQARSRGTKRRKTALKK